jgi:Co/Zn/Cd efflux system component
MNDMERTNNPMLEVVDMDTTNDYNNTLLTTEKLRALSHDTAVGDRRSKENIEILVFTCAAFFLFVVAEIIGAVLSNSLSLLGGN